MAGGGAPVRLRRARRATIPRSPSARRARPTTISSSSARSTPAKRWLELAPDSEVARRYLATGLLRLYDEDAAAAAVRRAARRPPMRTARAATSCCSASCPARTTTPARPASWMGSQPRIPRRPKRSTRRACCGSAPKTARKRSPRPSGRIALRADWPQAELARVRALATVGPRDEALARSAEARGRRAIRTCASATPGSCSNRIGATRRSRSSRNCAAPGGPAAGDAAAALAAIAIDEGRFDDATRLLDEARARPGAGGHRCAGISRASRRNAASDADAARQYQGIDSGPRALTAQLRAHRLLRKQGAPALAEVAARRLPRGLARRTRRRRRGHRGDPGRGGARRRGDRARRPRADAHAGRRPAARARFPARAARPRAGGRRRHAPGRGTAPERSDRRRMRSATRSSTARVRSKKGTRLIERALAAKPDSYAIQDSMGWALVQAGPARGRQGLARQGVAAIGGSRRSPRISARRCGGWDATTRRAVSGTKRSRTIPDSRPAQARDRAPPEVSLRFAACRRGCFSRAAARR